MVQKKTAIEMAWIYSVFVISTCLLKCCVGNPINSVNLQTCKDLCSSCDGIAVFVDGKCECSIEDELHKGLECLKRMRREAFKYGMDFTSCDSIGDQRTTRCTFGSKHHLATPNGIEQVAKYFEQDGPITGSIFIAPPFEESIGKHLDCVESPRIITQPSETMQNLPIIERPNLTYLQSTPEQDLTSAQKYLLNSGTKKMVSSPKCDCSETMQKFNKIQDKFLSKAVPKSGDLKSSNLGKLGQFLAKTASKTNPTLNKSSAGLEKSDPIVGKSEKSVSISKFSQTDGNCPIAENLALSSSKTVSNVEKVNLLKYPKLVKAVSKLGKSTTNPLSSLQNVGQDTPNLGKPIKDCSSILAKSTPGSGRITPNLDKVAPNIEKPTGEVELNLRQDVPKLEQPKQTFGKKTLLGKPTPSYLGRSGSSIGKAIPTCEDSSPIVGDIAPNIAEIASGTAQPKLNFGGLPDFKEPNTLTLPKLSLVGNPLVNLLTAHLGKPFLGIPEAIHTLGDTPGIRELVNAPAILVNSFAHLVGGSAIPRNFFDMPQREFEVGSRELSNDFYNESFIASQNPSSNTISTTDPTVNLSNQCAYSPTVGSTNNPSDPHSVIGSSTTANIPTFSFLGTVVGSPLFSLMNPMIGASTPNNIINQDPMVGATSPFSFVGSVPTMTGMPVVHSLGTITPIVPNISPTYILGSSLPYLPTQPKKSLEDSSKNAIDPQVGIYAEYINTESEDLPQKKICKKSIKDDFSKKLTRDIKPYSVLASALKELPKHNIKRKSKLGEQITTETPKIEMTTTPKSSLKKSKLSQKITREKSKLEYVDKLKLNRTKQSKKEKNNNKD